MAWEDNLLDASFRGVVFDCISTDDEIARAVAMHSYPYAEGAESEDLGGEPNQISLTAIFYGDDYDARLQSFLDQLNEPGTGDLIHPVFGTINAQFLGAQIHHEADSIDQASVSLRFIQSSVAPKFFDKTLPIQKASAILQSNTTARDAAAIVLADAVNDVVNSGDFNRIEQLRTSMFSALAQIKSKVAGVISSGLDPINYANSWASDLTSAISAIVDLRSFDVDTLTADWKATFNALDGAVLLPNQARQPTADVQVVAAQIALEQANGRADAASLVIASETQTPTLTATEIEEMVNAVRAEIQAVIVLYRARYGLEQNRPVVEALKNTALTLQDAARAVIEARPPLLQRTINAPGNLRLIAHKFYGDHTRATELFRLNPKAKTPNFIDRGDILNAYAS